MQLFKNTMIKKKHNFKEDTTKSPYGAFFNDDPFHGDIQIGDIGTDINGEAAIILKVDTAEQIANSKHAQHIFDTVFEIDPESKKAIAALVWNISREEISAFFV